MTGVFPTTIFFHPDAVEGEGRDLVGRRSAGQSFLKGYLRRLDAPQVHGFVEDAKAGKAFEAAVRALGDSRPVVATHSRFAPDFARSGTIFYPTPGYQNDTWHRQRTDPKSCSLVGITHTVSTRRIIEALHHLVSQPVEDWDAIICTSRAVRSVVQNQFEAETAYFKQRFGAVRVPLPQLPVIPLGIEAADFAPRPGARAAFRAARDVPQDALVVMSMGRLSIIEKANPVPMLMALERAAEAAADALGGREVHLWLAGWTHRADEEKLHRAAADVLCRRVRVTIIDGRDPVVRRDIWAAADIFSLPSDSIQETFGLVPVEAMAAGLPVVMPDWDGFRDTVRHGETGFLIPTRMAAPGMGAEISARFADGRDSYLQYLTLVQSQVQIDIPAYADAFAALLRDEGLRARMGAAGRAHVAANLDWSAVLPRYFDLASALADRRRGAAAATTPAIAPLAPSPMQIDPFLLYATYPTHPVRADDRVSLAAELPDLAHLDVLENLSGRHLYRRHAASVTDLHATAAALQGAGALTVTDLATALGRPLPVTATMVLILAKVDIVRIDRAAKAPDPAPI